MTARSLSALFAILVTAAPGTALAGDVYFKWHQRSIANTCQVSGGSHSIPCCTVDGWDWSGNNDAHRVCPTQIEVSKVAVSCTTDLEAGFPPRIECPAACGCGESGFGCPGIDLTLQSDGAIDPASYQCDRNSSGGSPEQCDGLSPGSLPVDAGCNGDEHGCQIGDSDPAPVRYSSGRVESNPITLFTVPTPDEVLFGYRIMYNSQGMRTAAQHNIVNFAHDPIPVIHASEEDTHYIGLGWLDNFSDRLYITAPNTPNTQITWASQTGTVTFLSTSTGAWKSWSGKFELIDRGGDFDGFGRWLVRSSDPDAPRQIWSFEEFQYQPYNGGAPLKLGRLRRRSVATVDPADVVGRYGFTVTWTDHGKILHAIDTLGRELDFEYKDEFKCTRFDDTKDPPECTGGEVLSSRLKEVKYKPAATEEAVTVVSLTATAAPANDRLERVERPGFAGYTRFSYDRKAASSNCLHCNALLTDVIVSSDAVTASPASLAPPIDGEVVLEHDDYAPVLNPDVPVAVHSQAPGREYAYQYTFDTTTQFDLLQDGGTCSAGQACPAGYACFASGLLGPRCYVADVMKHDPSSSLGLRHVSAGAVSPGDVPGNAESFVRRYTPTGAPHDLLTASGTRTTYGYDSRARLRCLIHNDDDVTAFADPSHPDTSDCAGPASSHITRIDYTATARIKTTPGILGEPIVRRETYDPVTLLVTQNAVTGKTRSLDGTERREQHETATSYDALGRIIGQDGPLDDALAFDAVQTSYYEAFDPAWPYNLGQRHQRTHYVGTSASHRALTTTYAEYDLFGIAHRVIAADGSELRYQPDDDRVTWTVTQIGSNGAAIGAGTVRLDIRGNVRVAIDPDGVCTTYEYRDETGYLGVVTKTQRNTATCGLPIDPNVGEVEIRTYLSGDPSRLSSIERRSDGVTQLRYTGFRYDRNRRMTEVLTPGATQPFALAYQDLMPSGTTAPGGPAPGSWRTDETADAFGRPSMVARFLDAANKQTYTYTYDSSESAFPTKLERGINGGATSTTTFVYDDFGRVIETTVPEVGAATRYDYDAAGRLIDRRVAVGTTDVSTTHYTYDSLGRVTYVDNDVEHPVDCRTAPAGTAIQDLEYRYDDCDAGDTPDGVDCSTGLGRRTLARAVMQCGSQGDVVKRGTWYSYDPAGRLREVAFATSTGAGLGAPARMTYGYTAAGRLETTQSPLGEMATAYTYDHHGRITKVDVDGTPVVSEIGYQAFGGVSSAITGVVQPTGGTTRALRLDIAYRLDQTPSSVAWSLAQDGTGIDLLAQTLSYGPAGLPMTRIDSADGAQSRYYGYDALTRLTCEARGDAGNVPSANDCTPAGRIAGLWTYGNGESPTSPPDARLSSLVNTPDYTSPASETVRYNGGSGRALDVQRGADLLSLGYDGRGRRTFDFDSGDPVRSRRDYTYLPNGQLGSVSGQHRDGSPYAIAVRYDPKGLPVTITGDSASYELFWDDRSRLAAAVIDGGRVTWNYHYLGDVMVAATRAIAAESMVATKRFWLVTDERGLIHRVVDEVGATYWQARWDASGWRQLVGTPQPDMWVPFALPGQIVLEGSAAARTAGDFVRPPIVLNQLRAYDPMFGAFLQPDPEDQTGRQMPESYAYGRNNPVAYSDPDGAKTGARFSQSAIDLARRVTDRAYTLDANCQGEGEDLLRNAIAYAFLVIADCTGKDCMLFDDFGRQWIRSLLGARYTCPKSGAFTTPRGAWYTLPRDSYNILGKTEKLHNLYSADGTITPAASGPNDEDDPDGLWHIYLAPSVFPVTNVINEFHYPACMAYLIAHEAGHGGLRPMGQPYSVEEGVLEKEVHRCDFGCNYH